MERMRTRGRNCLLFIYLSVYHHLSIFAEENLSGLKYHVIVQIVRAHQTDWSNTNIIPLTPKHNIFQSSTEENP